MGQWFARWMQARKFSTRLRHLLRLRFSCFAPEVALLQGLTDHTIGLSMGQTAENLAYKFGIDRFAMDAFAFAVPFVSDAELPIDLALGGITVTEVFIVPSFATHLTTLPPL